MQIDKSNTALWGDSNDFISKHSNIIDEYARELNCNGYFDKAKKYYLMAIENNLDDANVYYANALTDNGYFEEAKIFYIEAINKCKNDFYAFLQYANALNENGDKENAKIYYLEAIVHGSNEAIFKYMRCSKSKIEIYHNFNNLFDKNLKNTYQKIKNIVTQMEKFYIVQCFKRKLELGSKIDTCSICFDENQHCIPLECYHYYCVECYIKLHNICPLKCDVTYIRKN